jgi:hypothetical protein
VAIPHKLLHDAETVVVDTRPHRQALLLRQRRRAGGEGA